MTPLFAKKVAEQNLRKAKAACSVDSPWPMTYVISKLVEGANILLDHYDYDGCVHESISHARNVALEFLRQERERASDSSDAVSGVEAEVCGDIGARQVKGLAKYGMTVADNPLELKAWLQHAYEECLDQAIYLKRAIKEIDNKKGQR